MTTKAPFLHKFPLDFRVCAVIFLFSAYLFVDSRDLPDKAVLFPSIMLVCMMGLSAYCMARSLLKQSRAARDPAAAGRENAKSPVDLKAVCVFGCMTAVYAFLTPYLGFGLASLLFLGSGTVFFGERDKRAIIAIPFVTMGFVYGFFIYFLDVSIPFFPAYFSA